MLARWPKGGLGAEEVARQAGVSRSPDDSQTSPPERSSLPLRARSSLVRWKCALGATAQTPRPRTDLVEVPAPVSHGAVAEIMTNGGAARLAAASPAWTYLSPLINLKDWSAGDARQRSVRSV